MYRIENIKGEVLAENVSTKELRDITENTTIVIDVFDQETREFLGEYMPHE